MSPRLKPLLLPQLVQERQKLYQLDDPLQIQQHHYSQNNQPKPVHVHNFCYPYPAAAAQSQNPPAQPQSHSLHKHSDSANSNTTDHSVGYYTGNSSSSDITSPLTPTFSARGGHLRCSSSTSSLDLASAAHAATITNTNLPAVSNLPASPIMNQDMGISGPSSAAKSEFLPLQPTKSGMRSLPDVQEDPLEREEVEFEEEETPVMEDRFGLYSCLCDAPCEHRSSIDGIMPTGFDDYDIDYDYGFLSDGEYTAEPRRKRLTSESPFLALTSRFGSRIGSLHRWKSPRRNTNLMASPTTGVSFEHVLSKGPSSRSSSVSSPAQPTYNRSAPATSMSFYGSTDSIESTQRIDINGTIDEEISPEKDRAMATTPLLPPLMTNPFEKPASEPQSPLQSPTIAPASLATEVYSPPPTMTFFPRPSLSTRPSMTSLRGGSKSDIPFIFPDLFPEHDSWSDRLGHANFTINPIPYEPEAVTAESLDKFRDDWSLARVNYTKHLVRTGENYGTTSKIYGLTEAKWAEIDSKWSSIYDAIRGRAGSESHHQSRLSRPRASTSMSRSRSRGPQSRSRSGSLTVTSHAHGHSRHPSQDDFASMQWREVERDFSSIVPQMLAVGEAEGKFPERGDEDIVGPMHRDVVMRREGSTDGDLLRGTKFWKNLAGKVGIKTQ